MSSENPNSHLVMFWNRLLPCCPCRDKDGGKEVPDLLADAPLPTPSANDLVATYLSTGVIKEIIRKPNSSLPFFLI